MCTRRGTLARPESSASSIRRTTCTNQLAYLASRLQVTGQGTAGLLRSESYKRVSRQLSERIGESIAGTAENGARPGEASCRPLQCLAGGLQLEYKGAKEPRPAGSFLFPDSDNRSIVAKG